MFGLGDWYTIGVAAGVATAGGVLVGGAIGATWRRYVVALAAGVAAGVLAAGAIDTGLVHVVVGALAALCGASGAFTIAAGAVRRGGTRGGTIGLLVVGAVVLAALAFVPVVGYALPLLALLARVRGRRRAGERYAGLRILARD